jgi:uridine kinase
MSEAFKYKYLLPDYWSSYQGLFLRDKRKIRAEWVYRQTLGEDARTPEQVAADYELPVEAVLEAIHYCTHNEDFLRQEREREQAGIAEWEKKYPPLKPPGTLPPS